MLKRNKILTDSIALSSVRVFTMLTSIISTMILARTLPLTEYGTYSTGNLIINTATLISAFGLIDAVNYYYNGKDNDTKEDYINTVFFFFLLSGIIAALIILGAQKLITQYFHNPMLGSIYIYIAFRPFLQNFSLGLQNLQVSIGKAKIVAIRNAVISLTKLGAIIVTALFTKRITTIFICMLLVEIISMFFYYEVLRNNQVYLNPFCPDLSKAKEILVFCIPMGVYIQTNTLSRDLDKFVIGFFESTEKLAVYSNCSAKLPFDLVSGPLLVLLIPLLTRCIKENEYKKSADLFRCYLKLGYIFTFAFGAGCMLVGKQAVELLYGPKYLGGIVIFNIYIIVDMINFINYSLVLAAKGKTKELMKVSVGALVLNIVINYMLYKILGFIGPAIATVIITFGVSFVLLRKSTKILKEKMSNLFDMGHIVKYMVENILLWLVLSYARSFMEHQRYNFIVILVTIGGVYVISIILMNIQEIKKCFNIINNINKNKK